jgi:hypothetical protein
MSPQPSTSSPGGREPDGTKPGPASAPNEPGSDADARRRRVENDPGLSPVGPVGGGAITETASEERKRQDAPP